jgi:carbon monoxide dehydrogenase subunit G
MAMATVQKEIFIAVPREALWDAVQDVGALHTRLVPGFVVNTQLEGDTRIVTFGNGMIVREPIVSVDAQRFRLAWAAEGGALKHYNASLQLFAEHGGTRVVWTSDLLPHEMAVQVSGMQEQGLAVMKKTFEKASEG